jgi:hypothetical protein
MVMVGLYGSFVRKKTRRRLMKKALIVAVLGLAAGVGLYSAPAHAQATRTWVSGVGDDVNPCSRTAPCKTFAGAISKTAAGGEINCLDPGGFGGVTITKSIAIYCESVLAGVLVSGTNAIVVNAAATDIVVLRGLDIQGLGTGLSGVHILNAAAVHIEKCTIRGFRGSNGSGVRVVSTAGNPELYISDSHITDNGATAAGGGIFILPTGGQAFVSLSNVRVNNNTFGIANNLNSRTMISNSVISGNTTGVQADGGSVVRLANNDIVNNATGISGPTTSYGNNRIANASDGTAPTAAGPASTDLGQK